MKAAIYNPYLDTLGGGERYAMGIAQVLIKSGYRVFVQWKDKSIKDKLEERFGIDLAGVDFIEDVKRGDGCDVCFWVSDGSIPLLRARKNILHFQVPFIGVDGKSLLNKMKLIRVNEIICNSYFTKGYIDKEYGVESSVIYPPVDVKSIKAKRKENTILSVGRFSQLTQAKSQDVLVRAFKEIYDSGLKEWRLILAGGVEVGVGNYLAKLKKASVGYPIEIVESPDYKTIIKLYGKSKIYWSASGFGIDETEEPQKVEHFGITVVEAMAAGCVVFAYKAGGHEEIVTDGKNGYLWSKKTQLNKKTEKLIQSKNLQREMSTQAKKDSKIYEYERFNKEVRKILT